MCSQPEELDSDDSQGYRTYTALLRRLAVDPNFRLDPTQRQILSRESGVDIRNSAELLLKSWNCNGVEDLSRRLECIVSEAQLKRLSSGQEYGLHPSLLVAISALRSADSV